MDNITHTLAGVALSKAGLERYARNTYPTWLLLLGANSPDIDVFFATSGAGYLEVHRGLTHSLAFAPVMAAITAGVMFLFHRKLKKDQPYPWLPAFLIALAGALSHVLMDYITPYGTRVWAPFSWQRISWDICPVLDIWQLIVILAIFIVPWLFRLISEEIGAKRGSFQPAAIAVLVFLPCWWGVRATTHARAMASLESHIYRGMDPRRVSAYPDMSSPFLWHGVVDIKESLEELEVNLTEDFDPTRSRSFYPPDPSPALDAAKHTRTVRAFLDFAVYPWSYVERQENEHEVVFRDLRYEYGTMKIRKGAVARVRLDNQLRVLEEGFEFRPSAPVR